MTDKLVSKGDARELLEGQVEGEWRWLGVEDDSGDREVLVNHDGQMIAGTKDASGYQSWFAASESTRRLIAAAPALAHTVCWLWGQWSIQRKALFEAGLESERKDAKIWRLQDALNKAGKWGTDVIANLIEDDHLTEEDMNRED